MLTVALVVMLTGGAGRRSVDADEDGVDRGAGNDCPRDDGSPGGARDPDEDDVDSGDADTARVELMLSRAQGRRGERVALDLSIFTEVRILSLEVAIDFDETALEFIGVRPVPSVDGDPVAVFGEPDHREDNNDLEPGDQPNEGWIYLYFSPPEDDGNFVDLVDTPTAITRLWFRIKDDAEEGLAEVRFHDIGPVETEDAARIRRNVAQVDAEDAARDRYLGEDDVDDGGVMVNGVIGEVGFFLRGDANMDCTRDIGDAVHVLHYLFTGDADLPCEDAADSDDNAVLEIGDPLFTLNWLFTRGREYPEPYQNLLEDPTKDYELFCIDGFPNGRTCGGDS